MSKRAVYDFFSKKERTIDLAAINLGLFAKGYRPVKTRQEAYSVITKYFRGKLKLTGFETPECVLLKFIEYTDILSPALVIEESIEYKERGKSVRAVTKRRKKVMRTGTTNRKGIDSSVWGKVRYEAFKLYGNKCKCCGRTPRDGVKLHVDHILPVSKDANKSKVYDLKNLQILCEDCNIGKSNRDSTPW